MPQMSDKREIDPDIIGKLRVEEEKEPIASFLKMKLLEITPGYARVSMKLKPEYRNFNGLIFGGIITAVADQAFAYASNYLSYPPVWPPGTI